MPVVQLLANRVRNPGTHVSGGVLLPAGADFVYVELVGLELETADAALELAWGIDLSRDGGDTWQPMIRCNPTGGSTRYKDAWRAACSLTELDGLLVRLYFEHNQQITFGVNAGIRIDGDY